MDEGGSDSFTVSASNLVSSNSYTIRVTTSNSDIGFNEACSDRQEDVTVPANRTSYSTSITLHGCDDPGGTVTAKLRRGATDVDTASQYVTVNPPDPDISISNLVGSMDEGGSDSFTVSASNLVSSNSYTIRVTTSNSDIGFNEACSDRQEDVTVPANRTSYSTSITLHGCDDPGGTVTAKLRRGTTDVDTASQYVTVNPPDPDISISNLVGSMDEGGSDSFTVRASNLVSSNSYTIRVTTSNSDIGFNEACSDRQEDVTVPANRTSYSTSITLHGCDDPGGTVTAKLRRGATDVDTASQYVTVNPPDPGISISHLVGSMDEGGSDSFTVSASNLVSSNSYTIRVTTSNSDIGFNEACSDRQEDVTVPANRTSYSTSITLHGCDDPGGTVTAKLRRGATDVDTASQYVTVNPPDPDISISNLVGSMDEGGSDSFTVSASNLVSSNSYTIRVTTSNSDIGFNEACSDRQEDVTVPANRTSYSTSITLHGCDDPGGTVTAKLRRGATDVDTASQYVTVNPPDPGISISNLVGSMDEGGSDSFTVSASNLVSSNSYTIRVTTSNSDIGFNEACSDRQEDVTVPANRTSYSTSITLHGCDDPGGTVTAKLRRGATDVDTASQYVTVNPPDPGISISGLVGSMDEGGSDSFTVSASNLVSSNSYTIRVTTSNSDIGFNQACSDRQEDVTVPANRTSYSTSITLHGCDDPGGTVTAKLRRGTTDVDTASQYVTVNPPDPGVSISGLVGSMDEGGSDSFTVSASNLVSSNSYTIRVTTSNSDIGFNQACSDRQEDVTVPANRTSYSTSITLHGCDDPGGTVTAKLRRGATDVDTASQYVTVTAPPPPTVTAPGTMSQPRLTPGDRSLSVEWDAPTDNGGSAITEYRVQHKLQSASWPPDARYSRAGGSANSTTITGLTNGAIYDVRVQACNNSGQVRCGLWSVPATEAAGIRLAAPTNLDVEPRPERRVRLTWTPSANANAKTEYDVYAEDPTGASSFVASTTNSSPWREIKLDSVFRLSGQSIGSADREHFKLWVVARDTDNVALPSIDSPHIIIVDNPILRVDGSSPNTGEGKAVLEWGTISNLEGSEEIRFRRLLPSGQPQRQVNHSDIDWRPGNYSPWLSPINVTDPEAKSGDPTRRTSTILGLTQGELYAVQLNYDRRVGAETLRTFSAREVYVWPSDRAAGVRSEQEVAQRVATFPLRFNLPNRTYSYVFCADTFENATQHATTTWAEFIEHAFDQWKYATDNEVMIERIEGTECADYSGFVNIVRARVVHFERIFGAAWVEARIEAFIQELEAHGIESTRNEDATLNEVLSVRYPAGILRTVGVLDEVSEYVGHGYCYAADSYVPCTTRTVTTKDGSELITSDILIPDHVIDSIQYSMFESGKDILRLPASTKARFNSCGDVSDLYRHMVHEIGHALGISDHRRFDDRLDLIFPVAVDPSSNPVQDRYHSLLADSIVSYKISREVQKEYGCSPHPFDILAIFALYQTVH